MKKISMICLAAGLACAATAVAKPPLQLAEKGIYVAPQKIAPAKMVNGKIVVGEWQDYSTTSTRGVKGVYYTFDCFDGYVVSDGSYPNLANGGQGAVKGDTRFPGDNSTTCAFGSSRWYFGTTYTNALTVDDVDAHGCFDDGGSAVDSLDLGWWWGAPTSTPATCVISFFTTDASGDCSSDPLANTYYSGVSIGFGPLGRGGYYFTNVDGLDSDFGIFVQSPAPGGSYLIALTTDGSTLQTGPGTQMMLWGTGNTHGESFRPGSQDEFGWDDDNPISAAFETNECYSAAFGVCPDPLAKMVGMGTYRCPGDVNNDGFVNGDDYDAFASAFDVADLCADYNGDGFVNGDDYDAFASNFDVGC
ncbi:MAG: hypothetical protein HUU19_02020 [Phycisphaerales bacterium]|nr:hypothetical protein [Phycisphaerales bacterium]